METQVIHGDTLQVLRQFEPGTFDAVITDPPYSSGGAKLSDRQKPSHEKYASTKKACQYPDIAGDGMDHRSWTNWMAEWLMLAREASKKNAVICVFIDWRQIASCIDALQWAGWMFKGIAVWDKISSRPQKGRYCQQCEFIIWGCNGSMPIDRPVACQPGVFRYANVQPNIRRHQTCDILKSAASSSAPTPYIVFSYILLYCMGRRVVNDRKRVESALLPEPGNGTAPKRP